MISFIVRMRFRTEDRQEIANVLRELTQASRAEPGCVSYVPHTVESDPDTVLIYEQYKDESGRRGAPVLAALQALGGRWALPANAGPLYRESDSNRVGPGIRHLPRSDGRVPRLWQSVSRVSFDARGGLGILSAHAAVYGPISLRCGADALSVVNAPLGPAA